MFSVRYSFLYYLSILLILLILLYILFPQDRRFSTKVLFRSDNKKRNARANSDELQITQLTNGIHSRLRDNPPGISKTKSYQQHKMKWPWSTSTSTGEDSKGKAGDEEVKKPSISTNYTPGQKILLRDTPAKFQDSSSENVPDQSEMMKQAWDTISREDFTLDKLSTIPCFRDAIMVGFASMVALGSSMAVFHGRSRSSLGTTVYWNKIINWSIGGLLFGSIIGWEQCRLKRRRSFEIAQLAMDTVKRKKRPMLHPSKDNDSENSTRDELLKEWGEHPNDVTKNEKHWYKFW